MMPAAITKLLASKALTGAQLAQVGSMIKSAVPPQMLAKLGLGSKTGLLATLIPGAAAFAGGALVGVAVGRLTATKSGAQLREELKSKFSSLNRATKSSDNSEPIQPARNADEIADEQGVEESAGSWLRDKSPDN